MQFEGSITALVTPMHADGTLDLAAFRRLLDHQLAGGSSGVVVAGTTGESATLNAAELEQLLATALEHVDGRLPVIAGSGSSDTRKTIETSRMAERVGADALLVVTPYYNRPTQRGLAAHYRAVADAVNLPVLLYNVPGRTGVDLLPDTVAELAAVDNIVAVKEARPEGDRVRALLAAADGRVNVLSGDDGSAAASMALGAHGVISVAANVAPAAMSALCRLARAGGSGDWQTLDGQLQPLFAGMMLESNPIPCKWSLYRMGLIDRGIRLPLQTLAAEHRQTIDRLLAQLEDLKF